MSKRDEFDPRLKAWLIRVHLLRQVEQQAPAPEPL